MNAPGRVTTPAVRTWSRPGMSASGTRRCTTSPTDCARVSPSESAASYWPCSSRSAANARRQVSVWPFIVLPARMPTTGTSAMPVGGTVRVSRMMSTTGSRPASIASVAHGHALGASTRRTVVTTATRT